MTLRLNTRFDFDNSFTRLVRIMGEDNARWAAETYIGTAIKSKSVMFEYLYETFHKADSYGIYVLEAFIYNNLAAVIFFMKHAARVAVDERGLFVQSSDGQRTIIPIVVISKSAAELVSGFVSSVVAD